MHAHRLEIERLRLVLAKLRRLKFGRSSEQLDQQIEQLELTLEELESTQAGTPIEVPENSPSAVEKPARHALPEHLPREPRVYPAPSGSDCTCPDCGGALRGAGEDISEVLERIPSRFKVIRHIRPKFSCVSCQKIVQAAAPSRPIARGVAGPSMLAHVLVSKFCDHLPLYRIWTRVHMRYYESAKNIGSDFRFARNCSSRRAPSAA
jgi:transposase